MTRELLFAKLSENTDGEANTPGCNEIHSNARVSLSLTSWQFRIVLVKTSSRKNLFVYFFLIIWDWNLNIAHRCYFIAISIVDLSNYFYFCVHFSLYLSIEWSWLFHLYNTMEFIIFIIWKPICDKFIIAHNSNLIKSHFKL